MSGRTGIEWTDQTWNPVVGCTKVSQGCKFCYAKVGHDQRHKAHRGGKKVAPQYAEPFEVVQLKPERLNWPLSLQEPSRIFVNSVSDLFHEDVPVEFLAKVFAVMSIAKRHTFQVLTKRPLYMRNVLTMSVTIRGATAPLKFFINAERLRMGVPVLPDSRQADGSYAWPLPNVWLGVSVENQKAADERIPILLETPAAVRWLSCEPLLGPVDLKAFAPFIAHLGTAAIECEHGRDACPICDRGIDWVVVGGESGSKKQDIRPMDPNWARKLRDQCVECHVPFLFKQWGNYVQTGPHSNHISLVGKKKAGRELDGRTWDEFPQAVTS